MLANKDALSLWRANPSCKTARNCVEIQNMNLQRNWGGRTLAVKAEQKCVHIFGNEGRSEMWNYRSFAVNAEGKCGGGTSHVWQWRQNVSGEADLQIWQSRLSESAEAKLQIFGSPDRDEMRKRNFTSLEVLAEQVRKAELQIFASQGGAEAREQKFTYLAVKAERKCGSGTSHFWQSMQNESADVELQIFGSQGRAEMRTEAEHQVFGSQGRAEVWKRNFRSLAVKTERKCSQALWQSSQVGRAKADLNSFDRPISYWLSLPCWRITLLTAILKDNVKTMCG